MTTDPSAGDQPASDLTKPLRLPAALAMLGVNAVWLLILIQGYLLPAGSATFSARSVEAFAAFTAIAPYPVVLLPLLAVLLATHVRPALAQSAMIVKAALGEYAVIGVFAAISYLGALFGSPTVRAGFEQFFFRTGMLVLVAVAAFTVWKVAQPILQGPPKPDRLAAYGRNSAPPDQQWSGFPGQHSPDQASGQPFAQGVPPQSGPPVQPQYGQGYPQPPGRVYGSQVPEGQPPMTGEQPYGQQQFPAQPYGQPGYQPPQPTVYGTPKPADGLPGAAPASGGAAWETSQPSTGSHSFAEAAPPTAWDQPEQARQPEQPQPNEHQAYDQRSGQHQPFEQPQYGQPQPPAHQPAYEQAPYEQAPQQSYDQAQYPAQPFGSPAEATRITPPQWDQPAPSVPDPTS
ncbi:MAG: hypothetical protein QOD41_1606, partial [Cryptosporangiaceae bacterium]|nr:hypothetical protein [Cryptosporangiaceae bacterium]